MAIPKSKKLASEDAQQPSEMKAPAVLTNAEEIASDTPILVREVQCLNDFVAIVQSTVKSNIAVTDAAKYKNEGLVVGVGPGIADGAGGRLKPSVNIGDVVMFGERNIAATVESNSPPYVGMRVVIVSERNIICKLPRKIDWQPYGGTPPNAEI